MPAQRELSQLRLLPGIDGQTLRRLEAWVALLPKDASLNINTALPQMLATLEGVSPPTAVALASQRPATGYASVQAFTSSPLTVHRFGGWHLMRREQSVVSDLQGGRAERSRLHLAGKFGREQNQGAGASYNVAFLRLH